MPEDTAPELDFTAPHLDLRVRRGSPWAFVMSVPLDLTGCTFVAHVRTDRQGETGDPVSAPTAVLVTSTESLSVIRVSQVGADTAAIDKARLVWEVQAVHGSNSVLNGLPLGTGRFIVEGRRAVVA